MPDRKTIERARRDKRQGKSATTQAGEFVHEEIAHIREGKHGARSAKQAIAIGLSKARRAGVKVPVPKKGTASAQTRKSAASDLRAGSRAKTHRPSSRRSRAAVRALKGESTKAVSPEALSKQAKTAARRRKRASAS